MMYRCHFTRDGHVVGGENIDSPTLDAAILEGERILAERSESESWDGVEIWDCAAFLYTSQGHGSQIRDHRVPQHRGLPS